MNQIPCEMIRDLLPLVADDVVSEKTNKLVQEHLAVCDSCCQEYKSIKQQLELPANPDLRSESAQSLKDIKKQLWYKRVLVSLISVLATVVLAVSCGLIYENVGAVNQFFDPCQRSIIRNNQLATWQPLEFAQDDTGLKTTDTLTFNSIFYERSVVNDANSDAAVILRVLDEQGNVVLKSEEILPGHQFSLKKLDRNTPYQVEVRTMGANIFLNFV